MSISKSTVWARRRDRPFRVVLALLTALATALVAPSAGGAQTITPASGGLNFGTIMPGQTPVTIAPWTTIVWPGRGAPVFLIQGTASQQVYVRAVRLPATIENGSGGVAMVASYTVQYSTSSSGSGATNLGIGEGQEALVTLDNAGQGYVSIGATLTAGPAQPKGGYAFGEGGVLSVRAGP